MSEESLETLLAGLDEPAAEQEQTSDATEENTSDAADETTQTENETETEAADEPEGDKPDGEAEDKDEDEPEKPKKKLSGSERLKRRIAALEAELAERRPVQATDGDALARAVEAEIGAPPQEADFKGDYLAFERALTAYEAEKRIVARDVKRQMATQEARARAASAELIEDHNDRIEALEAELPGSREKLAKAAKSGLAPSDAVATLVLESEKSAHLAVHLAENPEALRKLNGLSPVQAAREIGRLEARLSSPKPKTATKAPPPVRPLKGAASPPNHDAELSAWLKKTYGHAA